jgi:hypothetical protein
MGTVAVRKCSLALIVALVAAGCGPASLPPRAAEQTITLNWHEASGPPGNRLIVDVRRFVVRRDGWAVSATVENDSRATLVVSRRHRRHGTEFGILLLPGASWSETFSGPGRLPAGDYVRIELGSFGASGTVRPPLAMQFEYITDHVFRLSGRD